MKRWRIPLTVWVAAGSVLGTTARWGIGLLLQTPGTYIGMPWNTLAVNVIGSFVIGLYAALTEPGGRLLASPAQRVFVMAGVCGGFTTFSMFTAEVLGSMDRGEWRLAAILVSASIGAWLLGVVGGYALGKQFNQLPRTTR